MVKIISILVLVLTVILFPPAALALISNNAVPGDATYPIKRTLEDGIFAVVSLNSVTKAWFAKARSDRRFKEITILADQDKDVSKTLNELIDQTDAAAKDITKIEGGFQKKRLLDQLSQSIQKYDKGLQEISKTTPKSLTPTLTPAPTSQVQATPQPSPQTDYLDELERQQREIEEARRRLDEIKRRIEEETKRLEAPIPTPTPTSTPRQAAPVLTPTPTPTPTSTPKSSNRHGAPQFTVEEPAASSSATSSSNLGP